MKIPPNFSIFSDDLIACACSAEASKTPRWLGIWIKGTKQIWNTKANEQKRKREYQNENEQTLPLTIKRMLRKATMENFLEKTSLKKPYTTQNTYSLSNLIGIKPKTLSKPSGQKPHKEGSSTNEPKIPPNTQRSMSPMGTPKKLWNPKLKKRESFKFITKQSFLN